MATVSSFQFVRRKIVIPQQAPNNFLFPDPIAYLNPGRYIITYPVALVSSVGGTNFSFINQITVSTDNFTTLGGNAIVIATKTNTNTVDSSGTSPIQPTVMYRNLTNTFTVSTFNTPIYVQYLVVLGGGSTFGTSTAERDANYNYITCIKIA
jgi:hypothetical protein